MRKKLSLLKNIILLKGPVFLLLVFFRVFEKLFRVFILRQKCVKKKINSMYVMELQLSGTGFDQELFLFRGREELETEVVKRIVKKGMRVFDLGANIGCYTLLLSHLVGEQGRVYAAEPLPDNFKMLQGHLLLNKIQNVVPENIAISDKTGYMNFFVGTEHNLGSLIEMETQKQTGRQIRVKALSLADYLIDKPSIDLIRMDIERGELKVFYNILDEFPKRGLVYPKMIMFEAHPEGKIDPDPSFTPLLSKLSEIGYTAKYTVSSANPIAIERYSALGYAPERVSFRGQGLFYNIKPQHLISIAARRPKITRAILLVKK